jgi:hypothetical protein
VAVTKCEYTANKQASRQVGKAGKQASNSMTRDTKQNKTIVNHNSIRNNINNSGISDNLIYQKRPYDVEVISDV